MCLIGTYEQSRQYSDKIMDLVKATLTKKKIKFESNPTETEIKILSKSQSKDSIKKVLDSIIKEIPNDIQKTLLEVVEVSGRVFIRQKVK